jgi:hypothetical protein
MGARLHDIVEDVNLAGRRIRTDYSRELDSGFSLTPVGQIDSKLEEDME